MQLDQNIIKEFFTLYGLKSEDNVFIRTFPDNPESKKQQHINSWPSSKKYWINPFKAEWDEIEIDQSRGWGVHFSLNTPKDINNFNDKGIIQLRSFCVDFDDVPDWKDKINKFELPPTLIVQRDVDTRSHVYWCWKAPLRYDLLDWSSYQRALASFFGCQRLTDVSNLCTLMRLPGSWHLKDSNNPSLLTITYNSNIVREGKSLATAFLGRLPSSCWSSPLSKDITSKSLSIQEGSLEAFKKYLKCVPAPTQDGVQDALYKMSCRAKEGGITKEKARALLLEWVKWSGRYGEGELSVDVKAKCLERIDNAYLYAQRPFGSNAFEDYNNSQISATWSPESLLSQLDVTAKGKIKNTFSNLEMILTFHPFFKDLYAFNELTRQIHITKDTNKLYKRSLHSNIINDIDLLQLRSFCSHHLKVEFSTKNIQDAIKKYAALFSFHPVRNYLNSISWDGKHRLRYWLFTYCNAELECLPEEEEIGHKFIEWSGMSFLIAAVARVHKPGTKYDHMLILEGLEGIGKSQVFRVLASDEWFLEESFHLRMTTDKDYMDRLDQAWIVEIAELTNLFKADQGALKQFISRQESKYRKVWALEGDTVKRQYVLAGTTNNSEYLVAADGNRRFLPVKVNTIHIDRLQRDRDQLWAEALYLYKKGFHLGMPSELTEYARKRTEDKEMKEPWLERVMSYLTHYHASHPDGKYATVSAAQIFTSPYGLEEPIGRFTPQTQKRLSVILKKLGYSYKRVYDKELKRQVYRFLSPHTLELLNSNNRK